LKSIHTLSLMSWVFAALVIVAALPIALGAQGNSGPTVPAGSVKERSKALGALAQEVWEDTLRHNPEFASSIGDMRFNDQISDQSVKAIHESEEREEGFLLRLASIEPTGLSEQEQISRELLLRQFTEDAEAAQFKEWEMPLNQMNGIYNTYPQLVAQLNFATVKDYDDWLTRLHAIPKAFDQTITNMSIGMNDKRMPPKFLLEKALIPIKELASQKPEDSPLALPLKHFPATISAAEQLRIKTAMLAALSKEVLPAYQRLAIFMEKSYIPAGRLAPGIDSLANGSRYYEFLLRRTTTTRLTAAQIHQIGLDEVKRDEAEMLTIAQKLGYKDLPSFRGAIKADPKLRPDSAESLLTSYRNFLTPMKAKLPLLFGHLPKAPFEVMPVPAYLEKTAAPAYYEHGTPDGSRPGQLFINTFDARNRRLYSAEAIAYHEGLPGHHLQISIAQELTGLPEFRKFAFNTAYVEGWGLYAEHLGKDVGFYQDPYSDFGRLEADIWRAIRLVVDTGVHSKQWSCEQMVQYFHDHSSIDETSIQTEVDRYIAWPSQATAYKIGQLKLLELRDRAKTALGERFDIRALHDQVLDSGALPLDLLSDRVDSWIAQQKTARAH